MVVGEAGVEPFVAWLVEVAGGEIKGSEDGWGGEAEAEEGAFGSHVVGWRACGARVVRVIWDGCEVVAWWCVVVHAVGGSVRRWAGLLWGRGGGLLFWGWADGGDEVADGPDRGAAFAAGAAAVPAFDGEVSDAVWGAVRVSR